MCVGKILDCWRVCRLYRKESFFFFLGRGGVEFVSWSSSKLCCRKYRVYFEGHLGYLLEDLYILCWSLCKMWEEASTVGMILRFWRVYRLYYRKSRLLEGK